MLNVARPFWKAATALSAQQEPAALFMGLHGVLVTRGSSYVAKFVHYRMKEGCYVCDGEC